MSSTFSNLPPAVAELLEQCRSFDGAPPEFWTLFTRLAAELTQAHQVRALVRLGEAWRVLGAFPPHAPAASILLEEQFRQLTATAFGEGSARASIGGTGHLLMVSLETGEASRNSLLELQFQADPPLGLESTLAALGLIADTPKLFLRLRQQRAGEAQMVRTGRALEVLAAVNAQRRFEAAAMALVNEVQERFKASRVTLGWTVAPYVRVVAMSGTDRFERAKQAVQTLEAALEETRDQEEELFWPAPLESDQILRDHEIYARDARVNTLLSSPLRVDGEVCGVLLLEREDGLFTEEDALGLRVIGDQTARYLKELRERDRWFGARWAKAWRDQLAKLFGPRKTWLKLFALAGMIFLLLSTTIPFSYRVDGTFLVRPEQSAALPAPFDGYLATVRVRPGDEVAKGETLLEFDRGELRVQEADALAEIRRYQAEAERAEADGEPADLRVARSLAEQARARLDLVRFRLERSTVRTPFEGVVVAGDLRDRLGAPLKQGDVLMQVAALEGLFVEIRIPERDIDLLVEDPGGEIAFASRPDEHFPIVIDRIEPAAIPESGGNFFVIRAHLEEQADWLRPGMSGVAKLDGGKRTLAWRATHRLIDFLRMKLWW